MPTPPMFPRLHDPVAMRIYEAMLGDSPEIAKPVPTHRPRLSMRMKLEARLEHAGDCQFFRPTFREHLERCVGYAARALDDARERLHASRPKPVETLGDPIAAAEAKSIVLIGPAARNRRRTDAPNAA